MTKRTLDEMDRRIVEHQAATATMAMWGREQGAAASSGPGSKRTQITEINSTTAQLDNLMVQ